MIADRPPRFSGLDERALPKVAELLRGIGRAGSALVGRDSRAGRVVGPWLRREPVIVVAVVSVVFAAVLLAVTGGDQQSAVPATTNSVGPALSSTQRLGPATGAAVASYLAAAANRRAALESLGGSQQIDAVVDLTGYVSPLEVDTLLAATPGVSVLRGFARVPPPVDAKVHVLVTTAQSNLATELTAAQAAAGAVAAHYQGLVEEEQRAPTPELKLEIDAGAAQASDARVDAAGLSSDCRCVFALVVSGPVSQLEQLAGAATVRVLDPAPINASAESLMVVPLLPQDTTTVSPLAYAGD